MQMKIQMKALFIISIALFLLPACALSAMGGGVSGGGCGGGGCGGGGGSGSVIDPPIGAALKDIPTLTDEDPMADMVEVSLDAKIAPVNVNGVTANLFTYNGLSPAPVIRAKQGDMLKVHFSNTMPYTTEKNMLGFMKNITNLHTHGLHVSPLEPADAAHISIYPSDTPLESLPMGAYLGGYDYEYDLCMQDPGCLLFYHSHSHGLVAEQHFGGMGGANCYRRSDAFIGSV
jgi:FtsP/CotA-like multicopper oxidase with cupredoxin domain